MAKNGKILRPIHANRGVEAKYRAGLEALIAEMTRSTEYWLTAAYRKSPPRVAALVDMAEDASPADRIRKVLADLSKRWQERFDEFAPKMAEYFGRSMFKSSNTALQNALRQAGWAVDFKMTPAMRDALNATIEENIALIRSIPEKYLTQVQGIVMRSYAAGRDLETMVKEIKAQTGVADRRAVIIARDQANKANAVVNRARSLELGLTKAKWMHSNAGKEPRKSHVRANGKEFDIAQGCLIDGEYIQPGEKINCRCTSRIILPI